MKTPWKCAISLLLLGTVLSASASAQTQTPLPQPNDAQQIDQAGGDPEDDVLLIPQGQNPGYGDDEDEALDPADFQAMEPPQGAQ